MRLRAMALAEGCWKRTASCGRVLKLCQLMASLGVAWVMVVVAPLWAMLPLPALIWPPVGAAWRRLSGEENRKRAAARRVNGQREGPAR